MLFFLFTCAGSSDEKKDFEIKAGFQELYDMGLDQYLGARTPSEIEDSNNLLIYIQGWDFGIVMEACLLEIQKSLMMEMGQLIGIIRSIGGSCRAI